MSCVIHRTKGLLDLRAITVMGLSAKPGTENPIGMFGTGLKYAIATLCRHGAAPILWIGRERFTFSSRADKFRGAAYHQVRMRRESPGLLKPAYTKLPFTTEYGKFWKPWMAFREIEANTRDELGETWLSEGHALSYAGSDGETAIIVELPEYVHAFMLKDETFLPGGLRAPDRNAPKVQVIDDGPRDKLYWRGLRVLDLGATKCVRTWNFLAPLQLTEDRTLKETWWARYLLATFIAESDDEALIRDVITADENHWEHRLDWPNAEPSATFKRVAMQSRGRSHGAWGYVSRYLPRGPQRRQDAWASARRPWRLDEPLDDTGPAAILDASGRAVFARPVDIDPDDWTEIALRMIGIVNANEPTAANEEPEISF